MKIMIFFTFAVVIAFVFMGHCESKKDPYEEGTHMDYRILCENGFVYKHKHGATMQIFNSDGRPLKCGKKIY
jgi:uncharacterized protein YwgA